MNNSSLVYLIWHTLTVRVVCGFTCQLWTSLVFWSSLLFNLVFYLFVSLCNCSTKWQIAIQVNSCTLWSEAKLNFWLLYWQQLINVDQWHCSNHHFLTSSKIMKKFCRKRVVRNETLFCSAHFWRGVRQAVTDVIMWVAVFRWTSSDWLLFGHSLALTFLLVITFLG